MSSPRRLQWLYLLVVFLDTFAESQVVANLNLLLSEMFHVDNHLGHSSIALMRFVQGVYLVLFGNFLTIWPGAGPLLALVWGNLLQGAYVVLLLVLGITGVGDLRSITNYSMLLVAAIVLFAGGEALGSMALAQTAGVLSQGRTDLEQTSLFTWKYSVFNIAFALGGSFVPLGWRTLFGGDFLPQLYVAYWKPEDWPATLTEIARRTAHGGIAGANVALLATCVLSWMVATLAAWLLHRHLRQELGPEHYEPRKALVEEFMRHKSYRELWAAHRAKLGHPGLQVWLIVLCAIMLGVLNLFVDIGMVLPKYLIWHHGQVAWFPIFTSINPLLITVLAPLVPPLLGCFRARGKQYTLPLLVVGTLLQASAPLWVLVWPLELVGIVVFIVQSTVGEAIAMPQLEDYRLKLIGQELLAYSHAIVQLPSLLSTAAQTVSSAWLLDQFCAGPASCQGPEASYLWLAVALVALTTPIGFGALWFATVWKEKRAQYQRV